MKALNLRSHASSAPVCVLALLALGSGTATAQVFDAGGQANLMHQQELLRNQTTGDDVSGETRRAKVAGDRVRWHRKNLQPEYERRVRANGKADADAWFDRSLRGLLERDRRLGLDSASKSKR